MKWIKVDDKLPNLETPVWMYLGDKIKMGCRSNYGGEGWLWCALEYGPYYNEYYIEKYGHPWDFCPISDDDYQPTHWMPLPKPPKL